MILKTYDVTKIDHLVRPDEFSELTPESNALDIFTDFKKTAPLYIEQALDVLSAEDLMKKTHVKLQLVLHNGDFVGTLAYEDLIGEKIMAHYNHFNRREIPVSDVMIPRSNLRAINFNDVKKAKIKDIIETLRNEGRQHCLVIDEELHHIRGVFSASDIARRLHIPIQIDKVSTFVDIYKAMNE